LFPSPGGPVFLYNDGLRRPVIFFFIAFFIYNLNLRPIPSGDTTPAALLPFAILGDHSITFDRFERWYESRHMTAAWFKRGRDGHDYSGYPILMPVLLTPLYIPAGVFLDIRHMPVERLVLLARIVEKLSASLIAALSVAAFLALAEKLTNRPAALLLTVVYAFGSQTWSTSSQALWQHGSSELAIILGLFCFLWALEHPDRYLPAVLMGVCAGCSVAFRPTNGIFFLVLTGYVLLSRWSPARKGAFAFGAVPIPAAYLIFNLLVFGHAFIVVSDAENGFARGSLFHGLPGLLISPSRGLLIFSPVFLFAAVGTYLWFRDGRKWHPEIYGTCLLVAVAHLIVISRWRGWTGGFNYGPRLLTDVVPCLVILMIPALRLVETSRGWKLAFASALLVSFTVQAIGVFFYPNGRWDALPQPLNRQRERVWNWKDNQIVRSARAGPVLDPYQLAYGFLKNPSLPPEERLKEDGIKLW
jgi:hypothetical protein